MYAKGQGHYNDEPNTFIPIFHSHLFQLLLNFIEILVQIFFIDKEQIDQHNTPYNFLQTKITAATTTKTYCLLRPAHSLMRVQMYKHRAYTISQSEHCYAYSQYSDYIQTVQDLHSLIVVRLFSIRALLLSYLTGRTKCCLL